MGFSYDQSHAKIIEENLHSFKELNTEEKEGLKISLKKPFKFFLEERTETEEGFYKYKYHLQEKSYSHVEALQGKAHFSGKESTFHFKILRTFKILTKLN